MDNNGYYTGISKHSNYMLPPVYNQIPFDSFNDYQASSQVQQQQQHQQQLPHQVQTTHQQHHDIQSISVKLDAINKSPQKNDEIQACSGGYTGNNTATSNDFHGNLYHYNKHQQHLDNGDGVASYSQTSVSNYADFDHIGGSSIGQKSLSSFLLPQQHHQQQHQQHSQQQHQQHSQQQNPHQNQQHQSQQVNPPTAAILPQQTVGNVVQNDISSQQSKVLGTFDRTSSKCYNNKAITAATNPLQPYQQPGYKDSEMPFNFNKLPPIPQTYHHVFTPYDKYSLQPRVTSHHKPYDDNPTNNRPYVCQTMSMATNHKPVSQPELFCSSSATNEQHNRFSNRNFLISNSAFTSPANGFFNPMYHRSNNVHRNLLPPPPSLQPAIDDSSNYYPNNNLVVRSGSYNRNQMAFPQTHYPYGRPHHPMPLPKLQHVQSKSDIDIMNGLTEDHYRPYNVSYDYDDFQFQVQPTVTHYPTKSSKVIFAPFSSNTMNTYPPSNQQPQQPQPTAHQQQQQQQQHHNIQPQQHHQSVIQNQVHSSNDYTRYPCSNIQPSSINCSNKVYLQDQYSYASHPQMVYSHGTNEMAQTELPKYNQMYEKRKATSTDKLQLVDLEEQITGSKILKTRELAPTNSYDCSKSNYKDQYYYNYNALNNSYQQLRGGAEHDASKNQSIRSSSIRDFLATWNDDEEPDDTETTSGKKSNTRRITSVDIMPRTCGPNKLEVEGANVSTTKIHFGIKVDNGGNASNNLPDIIIDIEKPKVVGSEESYSSATDKLYVLESIDVPFSDLNKYKHLSVVNKLPDNIVQIDRRKGDNLDDVEETLKLIEKCEERVPLHKSDFELDVKFDGDTCASPIKNDCRSDVGHEQDNMLNDPLNIHEIPIDVDQHTVPAPSPKIEQDEENSSNAHNKTADDSQEDDDIDEGEVEPMNEGESEVVRYKCVQKKVSTNGDELIHSDVSIPKLKIKIMRRKRSKSFRNRKIKNDNDLLDARAASQVDESKSQVKTLQLICLDVINTVSFRNYLKKDYESKNVFQYSGQTALKNNSIECVDEARKDGEFVKELVALKEFPSDLIENKNVNDPPFAGYQISENEPEPSPNINASNCVNLPNQSHSSKLQTTLDTENTSNNLCKPSSSAYDCFSQNDVTIDDSSDIHSLAKFKFHTPSVGEDFGDPCFETNFESIPSLNNDLLSNPIDNNNTIEEINPFFPLNNEQCNGKMSANADYIVQSSKPTNTSIDNTTTIEPDIDGSDKCIENIIDIQSVANLIDNLEGSCSVPPNRVDASELIESLHEFEELIGCADKPITPENKSVEAIVVNGTCTSTDFIVDPDIPRPNVYKIEPIRSDYTDSSSSSCSSSDDSDDSDSQTEMDTTVTRREQDSITSVTTGTQLIDGNKIIASNTSCSSSESESEEMDYKSSEAGSEANRSTKNTDSESSYTKSSSTESEVNEPKVKIESEELTTHSKSDDQLSHNSDNEFKSSSYSGSSSSSSDNSDESSTESDDEIVIPKPIEAIPKIENKSPLRDVPFIERKIKTEEQHPYSDATDDSSSDSSDETESDTATKDAPSNDNESVKTNSSSESSDDEYGRHSPIKSVVVVNENVFESSKTSADSEPSEEEDKQSSTSNPGSVISGTENEDFLNGSITECETCTDSVETTTTNTSVSQMRSTISEEKYIQKNVDIPCNQADSEIRLIDDCIKTEPNNEDSHVYNSDNSDDEYVKLSPLNNNLVGETSETQNHPRKVTQFSNKKIIINTGRNKKQVLSSDGYSTSTSSSSSSSSSTSQSSSSSSSDDEYSDDEVFERKTQITFCGNIDSIVSANAIKTEAEEQMEELVQKNGTEDSSEQEEIVRDVEVEIVQHFDNDIILDTASECKENEEFVEELYRNSPGLEYVEETAFKILESNALTSEHFEVPDVLLEENSADNIKQSDSIMQTELVNVKKYEIDFIPCSANDETATLQNTSTKTLRVVLNKMKNVDLGRRTDEIKITEANSRRTLELEAIVHNSDMTVAVEVNSESLTNVNENRTDPSKFKNSVEEESEIHNYESSNTVSHEIDAETLPHIDNRVLPSHEPMRENGLSVPLTEKSSSQTNEPMGESKSMDSPTENTIRYHWENDEVKTKTFEENYIDNAESNGGEPECLFKNDESNSGEPECVFKKAENAVGETDYVFKNSETEPLTEVDTDITQTELFNVNVEASTCYKEEETVTAALIDSPIDKHTETKCSSHALESTIQKFLEEEKLHLGEVVASSAAPKDLLYPVLDIPVKLIPLPGEKFNEELYQKLIDKGEIFPSRISFAIENLDDFYRNIPVEFIPLPGETIDETSPHFIELKRTFLENRKNEKSDKKRQENVDNSLDVRYQEGTETFSQSQVDQSPHSLNYAYQSSLVIYDSLPSLKVLCEKVLCTAGLHYEEEDEIGTTIDGDSEDISYVYIVNDNDDFWNCSNESSSPLIVCYDGELDDEVFVDTDISAPIEDTINLSENLSMDSEECSNTLHSLSIDSFTIDSHDIQYEEIVPVNRTMYKLETFKRYLQSKYIQKPNYIQTHCINKILKKYSNYQRYRMKPVQITVQNCKKRIENFKNLLKYPKSNEKSPNILATDRIKVKENGQVIPKNDVLRSNCDINKSKLLLLTNNNIKNKRNLNSTQRNDKLNESEVSTISSYVSEMTKNNHLKESRAFAKEIITNKRSIKSNVTVASTPIVDKSKISNLSHCSSHNQIAILKRKVSENVAEPMTTRNNKKRKLSFDDTLLGINRIYKQTSMIVECNKTETKSSSSNYKLKERANVYSNSNILNNSKDKVRRLIIPKSKIFDGSNVSTKKKFDPLVQIPFVKLIRDPHIDSLGKAYAKNTFKSATRK